MFIFFDTETTGKAKNFKAPMSDTNNWPRVTQVAFYVYDFDFKLIYKRVELVKPDYWEIPSVKYYLDRGYSQEAAEKEAKFFIDNGMLQENNEEHGIPMPELIDDFLAWYHKSNYLIAHNINFDFNVFGAEMIRYKKKATKKNFKICTMLESVNFVKAPAAYRGGGYKWPTLTELHTKIFKIGFDGAHDAGADVEAGFKCFKWLLENKVIGLPVLIDNVERRVAYSDLKTQMEMDKARQLEKQQTNINFNNVENE